MHALLIFASSGAAMTTSAKAPTSANTAGFLRSNQTATTDCAGGRAAIVGSKPTCGHYRWSRRRLPARRRPDCATPRGSLLKDEAHRLAREYERLPMRCVCPRQLVRAPL
jgi:hypothetical protein